MALSFKEILQERKTLIFFGVLFVATTLVYLNHFNNAFHFDDTHTVVSNPNIRSLDNITKFFLDGTTSSSVPQNQAYRPIVTLSSAIDFWIGGGLHPFYFHLDNFLFFLAQGVLMFFFSYKIFEIQKARKINFYIAAGGTLFYMLHPVMAETVNYIIARSDIQSTFFVVLAFVLYQYSSFCKKYFIYLLPILLGALAKPTAIMFGPLLLVYNILLEKKINLNKINKGYQLRLLKKVFLITLPSIITCVLLYAFVSGMTPDTFDLGGGEVYSYFITQALVIVYYFGSLFFPVSLSADTDWTLIESILSVEFLLGFPFVLGLLYIIYVTSRKKKLLPIAFGLLWFFIALIPTSSIIPLAEVMNDHRMFFPYVGLVLSLSYALGELYVRKKNKIQIYKKTIIVISVMLFGVYAFGTYQRNKVWDSDESLWADVVKKSPENGRGLMNYGLTFMANGDYTNAEKYFLKALKLTPNYHTLYINLGILNNRLGRNKKAESYFEKAISVGSGYCSSYYYYGDFLRLQNKWEKAIEKYEKALKVAPSHFPSLYVLMELYHRQEYWDKLEFVVNKALLVNSNDVSAKRFQEVLVKKIPFKKKLIDELMESSNEVKVLEGSQLLYKEQDYVNSILLSKKLLSINPKSADAYNNICAAYNQLKEFEQAKEACGKALSLRSDFELANNNLKVSEGNLNLINDLVDGVNVLPTEHNFITTTLKLYQMGQYDKVILIGLKGLQAFPKSSKLYNNLCAAYNQEKLWEKAVEVGKKGLDLDPENQMLLNNYNWSLKNLKHQ